MIPFTRRRCIFFNAATTTSQNCEINGKKGGEIKIFKSVHILVLIHGWMLHSQDLAGRVFLRASRSCRVWAPSLEAAWDKLFQHQKKWC